MTVADGSTCRVLTMDDLSLVDGDALRDAAESFAANEARRPYGAFPAPATSLGNRRDEPESPTTVPPMSPFDTMEEELAHGGYGGHGGHAHITHALELASGELTDGLNLRGLNLRGKNGDRRLPRSAATPDDETARSAFGSQPWRLRDADDDAFLTSDWDSPP